MPLPHFPDLVPPRTIDEVLDELDRVVAWSLEHESRLGYFATLYRKVTRKVKEGIASGFFDDGPRMERLDVVFAGRYLAALGQWSRGEAPTEAWKVAFEAAGEWRPLVLQQLLLGINAHINLDLGIAAAEVAPGPGIAGLRTDFDRINEILFSLVASVEEEIASISPGIAWLEKIGGEADEEIVRFSLGVAREEAWCFAEELAPVPLDGWPPRIARRDGEAACLGREVRSPGPFLRWGLLWIRLRESNDVRHVIRVLAGAPEPSLERVEARVQAKKVLRR